MARKGSIGPSAWHDDIEEDHVSDNGAESSPTTLNSMKKSKQGLTQGIPVQMYGNKNVKALNEAFKDVMIRSTTAPQKKRWHRPRKVVKPEGSDEWYASRKRTPDKQSRPLPINKVEVHDHSTSTAGVVQDPQGDNMSHANTFLSEDSFTEPKDNSIDAKHLDTHEIVSSVKKIEIDMGLVEKFCCPQVTVQSRMHPAPMTARLARKYDRPSTVQRSGSLTNRGPIHLPDLVGPTSMRQYDERLSAMESQSILNENDQYGAHGRMVGSGSLGVKTASYRIWPEKKGSVAGRLRNLAGPMHDGDSRPLNRRIHHVHDSQFHHRQNMLDSVLEYDADQSLIYRCPALSVSIPDKLLPWTILDICRRSPPRAEMEYACVDVLVKVERATQSITYRELGRHIFYVAQNLMSKYDLRKGDKVAFAATNCIDYLIFFYAVGLCGGVAVLCEQPIIETKLIHQFKLVRPRFVFTTSTLVDKIHRVLAKVNLTGEEIDKVFVVGTVHPLSDDIEFTSLKMKMSTDLVKFQVVDSDKDIFMISFCRDDYGVIKPNYISHSSAFASFVQCKSVRMMPSDDEATMVAVPFSEPCTLVTFLSVLLFQRRAFLFLHPKDMHDNSKVTPYASKATVGSLIVPSLAFHSIIHGLSRHISFKNLSTVNVLMDSQQADTDCSTILAMIKTIPPSLHLVHTFVQRGGMPIATTLLTAQPKIGEVGHILPNTKVKIVVSASQVRVTKVRPDYTYDEPKETFSELRRHRRRSSGGSERSGRSKMKSMKTILLGDKTFMSGRHVINLPGSINAPSPTRSDSDGSEYFTRLASREKRVIDTRALPPMTIGEVWVRGPQIYNSRRSGMADRDKVIVDVAQCGFVHTGNVGYIDKRGSLVLTPPRMLYSDGIIHIDGSHMDS